ncbi:uncharacterized protein Hap1MRO34_000803 [Clarias gariepinus]
MAQCRIISYHLIFLLILATTECMTEGCNKSNTVAVLNSEVTLACPSSQTSEVIWEILQGGSKERIVTNCSSSCTTEGNNNGAQQRLCVMRTGQDSQKGIGSLTIRPVERGDGVWYRCTVQGGTNSSCSEVKVVVKDEPQLGSIKECGSTERYEALLNSTYSLQCPLANSHFGNLQLIWGTVEGHQTVPITRCPAYCTSSVPGRPLCDRTNTTDNGKKLIISPVESTDSKWFWCALSNSTPCYQFRLIVKDTASPNQIHKDEGATQSSIKTDASSDRVVSSHTTVIMISSAMCVFLIVATLGGVYVCFKMKSANTAEPENPYEDFKDILHNDTLQYTFIRNVPETTYTFKGK